MNVQVSTVAWTAYNTLAVYFDGPTTIEELHSVIGERWSPDLEIEELDVALDELISRLQLVVKTNGMYDTADPTRRAAISRDRSDPEGWFNWRLEAVPGSLRQRTRTNEIGTISVVEALRK